MYFVDINLEIGFLVGFRMIFIQIKYLRVNKVKEEGVNWFVKIMLKECRKFNCDVKRVYDEIYLIF